MGLLTRTVCRQTVEKHAQEEIFIHWKTATKISNEKQEQDGWMQGVENSTLVSGSFVIVGEESP